MRTVKEELYRRGLSQRAAAKLFGVSESMLSRHLHGVHSPSIGAVNMYLHKLGIGLKMPEPKKEGAT